MLKKLNPLSDFKYFSMVKKLEIVLIGIPPWISSCRPTPTFDNFALERSEATLPSFQSKVVEGWRGPNKAWPSKTLNASLAAN